MRFKNHVVEQRGGDHSEAVARVSVRRLNEKRRIPINKFDPARIVHFEALKNRARVFAENQLRRMCQENKSYTSIAATLLDATKWLSHGTVIGADKAQAAGLDVTFRTGLVEALPCRDAQVDVVVSTLMFHHLPRAVRITCAREIQRVLVRGGRALIVDFSRGQGPRSVIEHFHRYGHVALDEVLAALQHANLTPVSSGPVGLMNLHYALARKAE